MRRSQWLLPIKFFVFLFFLSVIVAGCINNGRMIEVWINNQSQDRIKINNNIHIEQGEQSFQDVLIKSDEKSPLAREKGEFKIYRSNTHLATVTYQGELWPDPSKGESAYKDEIIIEEPGARGAFTASSLLGVISVSITHVNE